MKKVDVGWRGHDALQGQNKIGMLLPKLRHRLQTTFVPGPAFNPYGSCAFYFSRTNYYSRKVVPAEVSHSRVRPSMRGST